MHGRRTTVRRVRMTVGGSILVCEAQLPPSGLEARPVPVCELVQTVTAPLILDEVTPQQARQSLDMTKIRTCLVGGSGIHGLSTTTLLRRPILV